MPAPLSVVIPSHSRVDLLRLCVASVRRYAPAGVEVIVVDDGSAEGAVSDAARAFPGVRVLRLDKQSGFCIAANAGLATATNPFVELLNDDTEVEAGWADAAMKWFADPTVAAVAPLVLRRCNGENPPRIDSAGDRYYLGGIARKRGGGQHVNDDYLNSRFVFGASASSAFYRRDAVLAVGGFPNNFGSYFEDVDLSFRLHWAGCRVVYEPGARVWHRVSSSYGLPCRRLLEQQARNEERVFWRNMPQGLLCRALPSHLAVLAAKAYRRWREGQLLPFLRGKLGVLGEAAEVIHHRRWLHHLPGGRDWSTWGVEPHFWA